MSVDTTEPKTVGELVRVQSIEDPGEYRFQVHSDRAVLIWEHDVLSLIRQHFPHIWTVKFHPASLHDGEYTPARLEYSPNWRETIRNMNYIGLEGEIYDFYSGGSYSNGSGFWSLEIADIGNLSVVRNKLQIDEPVGRDGSVRLDYSGTAPHRTNEGRSGSWSGSVTYNGKNAGKLVRATVDSLNQLVSSFGATLSKKTIVSE